MGETRGDLLVVGMVTEGFLGESRGFLGGPGGFRGV